LGADALRTRIAFEEAAVKESERIEALRFGVRFHFPHLAETRLAVLQLVVYVGEQSFEIAIFDFPASNLPEIQKTAVVRCDLALPVYDEKAVGSGIESRLDQ